MKVWIGLFVAMLPLWSSAHPLKNTPIDQSAATEMVFLADMNILPRVSRFYFNDHNSPQLNNDLIVPHGSNSGVLSWPNAVFCEVQLVKTSDKDRKISKGRRYKILKIVPAEAIQIRTVIPNVIDYMETWASVVRFKVDSESIKSINCYRVSTAVDISISPATIGEFETSMGKVMELKLGETEELR